MTDIAIGARWYKLSQTNSSGVFQLQARQAQLKRRLAVIERRGGSAGGWRRSIYLSWRNPALILPESHRAKETAQTFLDVFCFSCLWEIALFCHLVWSTRYVSQFSSAIKGTPPPPPPPSGGVRLAHTSGLTHTHTPRHAHWAISLESLTRGGLLLSNGFSWPISCFLPGRT